METFNTIVLIAEGLTIICGLLAFFIKPLREKITHARERDKKAQENFEELKTDINALDQKMVRIDEKVDRNEAMRARTQILRFDSEMYEGRFHTKEHFDEILDQCDLYNHYCEQHPEFKNQRTVSAQRHINKIYDWCKEHRKFLDSKEDEKND